MLEMKGRGIHQGGDPVVLVGSQRPGPWLVKGTCMHNDPALFCDWLYTHDSLHGAQHTATEVKRDP